MFLVLDISLKALNFYVYKVLGLFVWNRKINPSSAFIDNSSSTMYTAGGRGRQSPSPSARPELRGYTV